MASYFMCNLQPVLVAQLYNGQDKEKYEITTVSPLIQVLVDPKMQGLAVKKNYITCHHCTRTNAFFFSTPRRFCFI